MSDRVRVSEPVHLPRLPNYLRTDSGATLDVAALSDAGCRELGRLWTKALIRHARARRKKQTAPEPEGKG